MGGPQKFQSLNKSFTTRLHHPEGFILIHGIPSIYHFATIIYKDVKIFMIRNNYSADLSNQKERLPFYHNITRVNTIYTKMYWCASNYSNTINMIINANTQIKIFNLTVSSGTPTTITVASTIFTSMDLNLKSSQPFNSKSNCEQIFSIFYAGLTFRTTKNHNYYPTAVH